MLFFIVIKIYCQNYKRSQMCVWSVEVCQIPVPTVHITVVGHGDFLSEWRVRQSIRPGRWLWWLGRLARGLSWPCSGIWWWAKRCLLSLCCLASVLFHRVKGKVVERLQVVVPFVCWSVSQQHLFREVHGIC